jgi:hypothetical protein
MFVLHRYFHITALSMGALSIHADRSVSHALILQYLRTLMVTPITVLLLHRYLQYQSPVMGALRLEPSCGLLLEPPRGFLILHPYCIIRNMGTL